ncbi:MAG: C40 family peptidase [Gemmatimonadaceae bacterium]
MNISSGRLTTTACLLLAAGLGRTSAAQEVLPVTSTVRVERIVTGQHVVATARQHLGVRYSLGGTTPKAFDCSGLVQFVYAQHGIQLPRTAAQQAGVGVAPYPGDLAPGDLLFFYGGKGAQHIAIYAGNDTLIHASSGARRVKLDRFTSTQRTWFGRRLIAVRRILPAERVTRVEVSGGILDPAVTGIPAELTLSRLGLPWVH